MITIDTGVRGFLEAFKASKPGQLFLLCAGGCVTTIEPMQLVVVDDETNEVINKFGGTVIVEKAAKQAMDYVSRHVEAGNLEAMYYEVPGTTTICLAPWTWMINDDWHKKRLGFVQVGFTPMIVHDEMLAHSLGWAAKFANSERAQINILAPDYVGLGKFAEQLLPDSIRVYINPTKTNQL